ncbi:MAG: protein tyrosine phosphatase [Cohaesibacteraceae bacterium]
MPPKLKAIYRRLFPSRLAERSAYFEPPLDAARRRHAWLSMLFVDHGFIRYVYRNFHKVDDAVYRSSQPLPHQVRGWARRGVKSIINLRGGMQYGSYPLEVEAAEESGIAFHTLQLRSRNLPSVEQLEKFEALFKSVEKPVVLHCKAGADRASLASALYFLIEHNDPERALGQMTLKFGHIKGSKTGVLDAMVETYIRDGASKGQPFMDWVRNDYDPEAIGRDFQPNFLSSFLSDTVLQRE